MGGANTGNRVINVFQELKASQGECKISKVPKPEAFRKKRWLLDSAEYTKVSKIHLRKQFLHPRKQIPGQDLQDPTKVARDHSTACGQRVSLGMNKMQELREWRPGNDAKPKSDSWQLCNISWNFYLI